MGDIRSSKTPTREFYLSAQRHAEFVDLLARTWQLVEIPDPAPHSATPFALLPGSLDEPLLLAHDGSTTRCLSNVCTHRGALLAEGPCRRLRCPYHGRTFRLDGALAAAPGFGGARDFPSPDDDLTELPSATWGPLRFASIDPSHAFESLVGPLRARIDPLGLERLVRDSGSRRDYIVNANWALWVENFLEGFHIPWVHPSLAQTLDAGAYTTYCHDLSNIQVGVARTGELAFQLPNGHPDAGLRVGGYYLFLFPTTMLNLYPWGLSINLVQPLAVDRTRIRYYDWVWDQSLRSSGPGAGLDAVELEDDAIVESTMRGIRSRVYRGGRYAPAHEQGVHHFHQLMGSHLGFSRTLDRPPYHPDETETSDNS